MHFLYDMPWLSKERRAAYADRIAETVQRTVESELDSIESDEDTDEARLQRLGHLLQAIEHFDPGGEGMSAGAIVERLGVELRPDGLDGAREALRFICRQAPVHVARLVRYLNKHCGRIVLGRTIEVVPRGASSCWKVVRKE
jgi:hypothetical protein